MRGRATQLVRRPALERGKTLTIFISRSSRVPSRPLIMADSPRERSSRSVSPVARSRSRPMSRSRSPSRSRVREWSRSLSRSPVRGMSRSPVRGMSRSPVHGMSGSPVRGMSRSPVRGMSGSPVRGVSRSRSPIRGVSRSRSPVRGRDAAVNPGNTLYVTGLSTRVTERDLESHFAQEGKVVNCRLVVEPRSRISRGFAFVTMGSLEDADRCVKYLNQSVLEGRYITVEKSRRKRPRTPTPGHYLGLKNSRESGFRSERGGGRYCSGYGRDDYGSRRSPRRSPYRGSRDYSPRRSPPYRGSRDYSPRRSPPYRGSRDYSPRRSPYGGGRSRRERSLSRSPYDSPGRGYGRRPAYAR